MKILITGGSGLLGQYLNLFLSKDNEILTLYNNNAGNCIDYNSLKLDITDFKGIYEIFSSFKPDVVIHTACFSRPEICEIIEESLVRKTNIEATEFISVLCEKFNSRLIYTSTDLVYDGNQGAMLKENASLNPVSLYAKSKFEAEKKIIETFDDYIILRTSLLFGIGIIHSRCNFHLMYEHFKAGKSSGLFYDQYRTPLSLINASDIISKLCKSDIKNIIFNFGGKERVSRTELGERLCDICNFNKNLIKKISIDNASSLIKVKDVSLNTDLLQSYGFIIDSLDKAIKDSVNYSK